MHWSTKFKYKEVSEYLKVLKVQKFTSILENTYKAVPKYIKVTQVLKSTKI